LVQAYSAEEIDRLASLGYGQLVAWEYIYDDQAILEQTMADVRGIRIETRADHGGISSTDTMFPQYLVDRIVKES
jgi:hypothetical protein